MLALEEARTDYIYGEMRTKDCDTDTPIEVIDILEKSTEQVTSDAGKSTVNEENSSTTSILCTPAVNLTSASSAAFDILNRSNKMASNNKPPVPAAPTPTHILKGATYYDSSKKENTETKPAFTAADFPVSKNGACPYCHSTNVVYIILEEGDEYTELPEMLHRLHMEGKAVKMKRGF